MAGWRAALVAANAILVHVGFASLRTTHHELISLLSSQTELKSLQVDFETFADEIEEPNVVYTNAVDLTAGGQPYRCYSPSVEISSSPSAKATTCDAQGRIHMPMTWDTKAAAKLRNMARKQDLTQSKLLGLLGQCHHLNVPHSDWSYSVCFGKEIVKYKGTRIMATVGRDLFHLGYHDPGLDRVFLNGSMTQVYSGGTGGRSSSIVMECSASIGQIEYVGEESLHSTFHLSGPEFCDWRPNSYDRPHLDRLLALDFGLCFNVTAEWWTYEYCHPDSLLQFHLETNGSIVTPMFLLGSLRIPDKQMELYRPTANPTFPFVRSSLPPMPDDILFHAQEHVYRNLPVEIIDVPPRILTYIQGAAWAHEVGIKGIALYMNEGSSCPEMPSGMRTTRVIFICPQSAGVEGRRRLRPVWVEEVRTCQYDMLVEAPSICSHPLLRPLVEKLPKTIRCVRKRNSLASSPEHRYNGKDLALRPAAIDSIWRLVESGDSDLPTAANWLPSAAAAPIHYEYLAKADGAVDRTWSMSSQHLFDLEPFVVTAVPWAQNTTKPSHRFQVGDAVREAQSRYSGTIVGVASGSDVPPEWLALTKGLWRARSHRDLQALLRRPFYVVSLRNETGATRLMVTPERALHRYK